MLAVLALLVAAPAWPQDAAAPLPLDPAIRTGTLENGLAFFARRNGRPAQRVALRLAVKAGSIDERDDQRGLAHFLEHMAFNGTTHFKPGELVAYLESIGARFGPHVNAYTGYDETVYMLDVPADREELLDRGFLALADFAGGMTLDPKEIEKERGVVIEEWRGRQGAGSRMQVIHAAAVYGSSRYVERLPIGTTEVLRSFPPARLREFYETWYRPDRMAVIVVGDIDPKVAETFIRKHFGPLPRAAEAAPRPIHPIPPHEETRFGIASDPEAQESSVAVVHKRPREAMRTAGDYRRSLVDALIHQMLNARFGERARQADAPFLGASAESETLGQSVDAFTLSARVPDGGLAPGLRALGEEIARLRAHGFGDAELERARQWTLAAYERSFNEREKAESSGLAFELIRHFLDGEPVPGIAREFELARQLVPTVTAAEAGARAQALIAGASRVVLAVAPTREGRAAPSEAALRGALDQGLDAEVAPWRDETTDRALLPDPPSLGRVTGTRALSELGVTVLTLSNGVEVWLKPTDFKNDQVLFSAYAKGGTSLASPADYHEAALSPLLVSLAGVGGFSPVELEKLLPGRLVNVAVDMSLYTHGVSGSATPRDLETALQLLHLHFTAPNRTPESFELLKRQLHAVLANQRQSPGAVFAEAVRRVNTLGHYTAQPLRAEDVNELDADAMRTYYDARFRNASDFTFFFAGAFTVDEITPLLTAYVGSLPATDAPPSGIGDVRLRFPTTVAREVVRKGQEPRSQTVLTFFADTGLDELEMHRARAATSVLEVRLRDLLREELGGTYSVGMAYSNTQPQPGYGTITVEFGSAPENVDRLVASVLEEVGRLQQQGPTAEELQKLKAIERRSLETSLRQNAYWLNSLRTLHLLGWDPRRILARFERLEAMTTADVHAAAKKYLPLDRYTVVSLLPERAP